MVIDPTLITICAAALAIVLICGAWQKLRDLDGFAAAIEQYRLMPLQLVASSARILLIWEAAAGLLLLPAVTRPWGAALAAGLLIVVTGAVVVNLLRGRTEIDCGCGGVEGGQQLSWALVARNGVLVLFAAAAMSEEAPRQLVWLDGVTMVAGTLALYGIYAAADQLLANRPRLLN